VLPSQPDASNDISSLDRMTRGAIAVIVGAVAIAIIGFVVIRLRVIVVAAVVALMVAAGLDPLGIWLERRGLKRGWVAGIIMTTLAVGLALLGLWIAPQLWGSRTSLGSSLSGVRSDLETWLAGSPLHMSVNDLKSLGTRLGITGSGAGGISLVHGIVSGAVTVAEFIEGFVLTVVFATYLLTRGDRYADWLSNAVRSRHSTEVRRFAGVTWATMGAYARAIAINGAVNAILLGIAMTVLRIPAAGPLALIAFIGGFFPVVGTITAGLLAALVALASGGLVDALVVVAVTAVLHHLEVYIVGPLIVGRWMRVHPAALVAALTAGLTVAGVVGLFLAPPLLILGVAVVREIRDPAFGTTPHAPSLSS